MPSLEKLPRKCINATATAAYASSTGFLSLCAEKQAARLLPEVHPVVPPGSAPSTATSSLSTALRAPLSLFGLIDSGREASRSAMHLMPEFPPFASPHHPHSLSLLRRCYPRYPDLHHRFCQKFRSTSGNRRGVADAESWWLSMVSESAPRLSRGRRACRR